MSSILPLHSDSMYSAKSDDVYDWARLKAPTLLRSMGQFNVKVEPDDAKGVVVLRVGSGKNEAVIQYTVSDASTGDTTITRVVTDVSMPNARTGFFANQNAASTTVGMFIALSDQFDKSFTPLPRG